MFFPIARKISLGFGQGQRPAAQILMFRPRDPGITGRELTGVEMCTHAVRTERTPPVHEERANGHHMPLRRSVQANGQLFSGGNAFARAPFSECPCGQCRCTNSPSARERNHICNSRRNAAAQSRRDSARPTSSPTPTAPASATPRSTNSPAPRASPPSEARATGPRQLPICSDRSGVGRTWSARRGTPTSAMTSAPAS